MNISKVDRFTHREELIYLAGIFDGEGCACIGKRKSRYSLFGFVYSSQLDVKMTDYGPVKLFHTRFGGSLYVFNKKPPHKSVWCWAVHGRRAAEVATQLMPFSRNERKKAALQCIVDFRETLLSRAAYCKGVSPDIQQYRELLHHRCSAFNAKGASANNQNSVDLDAIKAYEMVPMQLLLWNE